MSAKEQYKYAQRIMRFFAVKYQGQAINGYLMQISSLRIDILMKAWQTL